MNRGLDACLRAVSAADIAAIIGEDLDAIFVMKFQNLAEGKADGMIAKIRREVADAQTLAGAGFLLG